MAKNFNERRDLEVQATKAKSSRHLINVAIRGVITHRLHCSSFLDFWGFPYMILNMIHTKELPWRLWVYTALSSLHH